MRNSNLLARSLALGALTSLLATAACSKQGSSDPPSASTATTVSPAASPGALAATASAAATAPTAAPTPTETAPPADPVAPPGAVTPKLTLDTSAMGPGEWRAKAFGLPAVTTDGKRVAYLADKQDGMRGYANQAIVVRAVDQEKTEKEIKLLDGNEINKAESAPNASGTTLPAYKTRAQSRVDEATAYLAKSSWIALARPAPTKVPLTFDAGGGPPPIVVSGITFELAGDRLRGKDSAGTLLLDKDAKGFSAKGRELGMGQAPCRFHAMLHEADVDPERKIALVRLQQHVVSGGDSCNADEIVHLYRLGAADK